MALRAGLTLRDMEMVQFHPTGLLAGSDTRMTGTVLEEGLRGAGGYLLNGSRERFMRQHDTRAERATRDIVSRAMFAEMRAGNTTPNGGLYLTLSHLGPDEVRKAFKGMVERCADCGFDLAAGMVEVVPTAHYMMGGVLFNGDCSTSLPGLFAAGEDTGGVHGANRLGGNGVANSTVFGGIAGDAMAAWLRADGGQREPDEDALQEAVRIAEQPFNKKAGDVEEIREALLDCMWDDVGIVRDGAGLTRADQRLNELENQLNAIGMASQERAFNLTWHDWLNLSNLILVSKSIRAAAARREESRGAHFRQDFPERGPLENSSYITVRLTDASEPGKFQLDERPVRFSRVKPGQTLITR
jgi:fumarate reductase flavoprotein subunit